MHLNLMTSKLLNVYKYFNRVASVCDQGPALLHILLTANARYTKVLHKVCCINVLKLKVKCNNI